MKGLNTRGLLKPFSLEYKTEYLTRFMSTPAMVGLFDDPTLRTQMAEQIWRAEWLNAQVTVRLLDGNEYFIS